MEASKQSLIEAFLKKMTSSARLKYSDSNRLTNDEWQRNSEINSRNRHSLTEQTVENSELESIQIHIAINKNYLKLPSKLPALIA